MDNQPAKQGQPYSGPLGRRISRRQAIKLGGLATLGLAFHKPIIQTIKPTQIFANNCYGCQATAFYSPSPVYINPFLPPTQPAVLTTTITFCVDDSIYNNQGVNVELVDQDPLADQVLAQQFVPITPDDLPGTCIQGRALTWNLGCSPFQGFQVGVIGESTSSGESSPILSVRFAGQRVGQVQAICLGAP